MDVRHPATEGGRYGDFVAGNISVPGAGHRAVIKVHPVSEKKTRNKNNQAEKKSRFICFFEGQLNAMCFCIVPLFHEKSYPGGLLNIKPHALHSWL